MGAKINVFRPMQGRPCITPLCDTKCLARMPLRDPREIHRCRPKDFCSNLRTDVSSFKFNCIPSNLPNKGRFHTKHDYLGFPPYLTILVCVCARAIFFESDAELWHVDTGYRGSLRTKFPPFHFVSHQMTGAPGFSGLCGSTGTLNIW